MNLNMNVNKEQLKEIGNAGLRIGKFIVVEGTKALVLKTAAVSITTSFEKGVGGVKSIGLDDIVGEKKDKSNKKKWFSKKKKDEVEEIIDEITDEQVEAKFEEAKQKLEKLEK